LANKSDDDDDDDDDDVSYGRFSLKKNPLVGLILLIPWGDYDPLAYTP